MGREAEAAFKERAKDFTGGFDFVSREEFDAVKELAAKARTQADALAERVVALEAKLGIKAETKPAAKPKAAPKAAAPKAATAKPKAAPTAKKPAAKK